MPFNEMLAAVEFCSGSLCLSLLIFISSDLVSCMFRGKLALLDCSCLQLSLYYTLLQHSWRTSPQPSLSLALYCRCVCVLVRTCGSCHKHAV